MKLIQTKFIDLRPHFKTSTYFGQYCPTSSYFVKTRCYFESDIYNDATLQELQTKTQMDRYVFRQNRCVALELTRFVILIATSENFFLFGRKTVHSEQFQKIRIDTTNHNARIHSVLALTFFEDDVFLTTLRDGAMKSFCYNERAHKSDPLNDIGEDPSIFSVQSLPTMPPSSADHGSASSSISSTSTGAFMIMIGPDMGKTCRIQNIVYCERKLYDEVQALNNLDINEYNAIFLDNTDRDALEFIRFVNDHILMKNTLNTFAGRRQQIVQLMKSKQLAMLHRGRLRLFEFRNREISNSNIEAELMEAASTIGNNDDEYLVSDLHLYSTVTRN